MMPFDDSLFDEIPPEGGVLEVAPGIWWARMPLPFALDHVNVWLLDDGDGWMVIDTGIGGDRTRDAWCRIWDHALAGRPITRLLVTHFHPDHIGEAGWIQRRWGTDFLASRTEWLLARVLTLEPPGPLVEASDRFHERAGLDADLRAALAARGHRYATAVSPPPLTLTRLAAGDTIRVGGASWRVMIGTGHSPEAVCLYSADRNVLIAGDQILPRISPNVSVWAREPDDDPVGDFLGCLDGFRTLPETVLVLPSHGRPFRGLHSRLDQLAAHHADRLAAIEAEGDAPRTAADVMRGLFPRSLDLQQIPFAIGEAVGHLNHLMRQGRLRRFSVPGEEAWRYARRN